MFYKEDKINYRRNFSIGVNISLLLCIILLLVYPSVKNEKKMIPYFSEPIITIADIPRTNHESLPPSSNPYSPPVSNMFEPINEPELLPDLEIKEILLNDNTQFDNKVKKGEGKNTGVYEVSSLPFIPRQILEVVPQNTDGIKGLIKVKVLVGIDGYIKQYKVLSNSTNSIIVQNNVVEAVSKSRWQPITFEGEKIEYWIEKTYRFN